MSDATTELARACVSDPRYRRLDTLTCDYCCPYRIIAATYVDPAGRIVLWLAGERAPDNRSDGPHDVTVKAHRLPPSAVHLPINTTDPVQLQTAVCPRCRRGKLLLPTPDEVVPVGDLSAPGFGRVAPNEPVQS